MGRVIGRRAPGDDPAARFGVGAEGTELELVLGEITDRALLVAVGGAAHGQADTGAAIGMLVEELGVGIVDHLRIFLVRHTHIAD